MLAIPSKAAELGGIRRPVDLDSTGGRGKNDPSVVLFWVHWLTARKVRCEVQTQCMRHCTSSDILRFMVDQTAIVVQFAPRR